MTFVIRSCDTLEAAIVSIVGMLARAERQFTTTVLKMCSSYTVEELYHLDKVGAILKRFPQMNETCRTGFHLQSWL